jgi:hypothetical protein
MPVNTLGNLGDLSHEGDPVGAFTLRDLGSRVMSPYAGQSTIRTVPPNYNTPLSPLDEMALRQWVARNNVPFNPDAPTSDYDMRAFYRAQQQGDPRARTEVNPYDQRLHFTDAFKTPLHETFSGQSQYAGPVAPRWNADETQLISPSGQVLFDVRK